jgi:hypothetical protein
MFYVPRRVDTWWTWLFVVCLLQTHVQRRPRAHHVRLQVDPTPPVMVRHALAVRRTAKPNGWPRPHMQLGAVAHVDGTSLSLCRASIWSHTTKIFVHRVPWGDTQGTLRFVVCLPAVHDKQAYKIHLFTTNFFSTLNSFLGTSCSNLVNCSFCLLY